MDCLSRSSDASPTDLPYIVSRDRTQFVRAQGLVQAMAVEAGELLKLQRWQRRQQLAAEVMPLFEQLTPPQFEQLTPMLVMPFTRFEAQGRIMKSTKVWRNEALATGALVMWWKQKGGGKTVIFISHTWWDREFKDETNDPNDQYDQGAPDYQAGKKQNLKWRVICAGVRRLARKHGLKEEDISLWVDWQSIYQDDKEEKLKGVKSLIKIVSRCEYFLVPTEEVELKGTAALFPRAYGSRGWWCVTKAVAAPLSLAGAPAHILSLRHAPAPRSRIEHFVFSRLAEMRGLAVRLYVIQLDGTLNYFPDVSMDDTEFMPSRGALSNPDDFELIMSLEDKMIEAFGKTLVEVKCKEAWCLRGPASVPAGPGGHVDLEGKMIRLVHMGALFSSADCYHIASLDLRCS